jgi:hypothetical protein
VSVDYLATFYLTRLQLNLQGEKSHGRSANVRTIFRNKVCAVKLLQLAIAENNIPSIPSNSTTYRKFEYERID